MLVEVRMSLRCVLFVSMAAFLIMLLQNIKYNSNIHSSNVFKYNTTLYSSNIFIQINNLQVTFFIVELIFKFAETLCTPKIFPFCP